MKLRSLVVLICLLVGQSLAAWACSCVSHGPACQTFWTTDSIFVGEVLTIEKIIEHRDNGGHVYDVGQLVVRFRVKKAYRGNVPAETTVQTGLGGGDCGFYFERGRSYLVYGHVSNGNTHTGICSPTQPVEQAEKALAWLDSLLTLPKEGRIFGTVNQRLIKENQFTTEPVAGVTVSVTNSAGRKNTVSTDSSGNYSVAGLPADSYSISAVPPKGMTGSLERLNVALHEQGCAEASFWLTKDGRISGRVLDPHGVAAKGIMVAVAHVESPNFKITKDYLSFDRSEYTNDQGRYQFQGLLPGTYIVFLNPLGFTEERPYPRQFYGGHEEPGTAAKISVSENKEALDIDFTLPRPLTWKSIAIEVKDEEGLPVEGAQVTAHDYKNPLLSGLPSQNTGPDGMATLKVYAERNYYVTATINVNRGQRCGGPVVLDPMKVNTLSISIVHPIGNCMAYLNPGFKGPR